jgi:DUF4097 and DUF4098 domain-containing protein YvlB
MRLIKIAVLFVALFGSVACFSYSNEVQREKELKLSTKGIESLSIDCGAGFLKIQGVDGLSTIEVDANVVVRGIKEGRMRDFIEDKVRISLEKRGNKAVLKSIIDNKGISSIFGTKSARIDLDVRIPKSLALDIEDGSGTISILDIDNNIELDDGSGSIEIEKVKGNVRIEDGSGNIKMITITGNVKIDDGSGGIYVEDVGGDVDIEDNSGTLEVKVVKGSVVVDDGSGGIYIDDVGKDVTIKSAGSGTVSIKNVKGKVRK